MNKQTKKYLKRLLQEAISKYNFLKLDFNWS